MSKFYALPSSDSSSSMEKFNGVFASEEPTGTHRVYYSSGKEWDYTLETEHHPIDVSLVLPHYRARDQPRDHRLNMFIGSDTGSIKVKLCRKSSSRIPFYLEIQALTSDVTVYVPSDFKGQIHHSGRATFSAGFTNRVMPNAAINDSDVDGHNCGDEVLVNTEGEIRFKMWDVSTSAPEQRHVEVLKRVFTCSKKTPETAIDWDFLLEDQ